MNQQIYIAIKSSLSIVGLGQADRLDIQYELIRSGANKMTDHVEKNAHISNS